MTLGWPWPFYDNVKFGTLGVWMEKAEKVIFSVTVIVYDMEMQSILTPMNAKGQGHLVTLVKDHSCWIKSFFLETTRLIEKIFHIKSLWDRRMT